MCFKALTMRVLGVLLCGLTVFYFQQHWKFNERFDQLSWIGERRCIPLWYPYYMIEGHTDYQGNSEDVQLSRMDLWEGGYHHERYMSARDKEIAAWLLQSGVDGVTEFRFRDGVLAGSRLVDGRTLDFSLPESDPWTNYVAYFVFATNMDKVAQFRSKDAYLEQCREYGVDGNDLKTFDENFKDYKVVRDAASGISNVVRTNFASGVSMGEWYFYIHCAPFAILVVIWPLVTWSGGGTRKRLSSALAEQGGSVPVEGASAANHRPRGSDTSV